MVNSFQHQSRDSLSDISCLTFFPVCDQFLRCFTGIYSSNEKRNGHSNVHMYIAIYIVIYFSPLVSENGKQTAQGSIAVPKRKEPDFQLYYGRKS